MKAILYTLVLFLVAISCDAAAIDSSICKVATSSEDGSGFIVAGDTQNILVITTSHVFPENATPRAELSWNDGAQPRAAKLLKIDRSKDLALLQLTCNKTDIMQMRYPLSLDRAVPSKGPFVGKGFSQNRITSTAPGKHSQANLSSDFVFTSPNQPGMSGGPVLDKNGKCVGVMIARKDGMTVAVSGQTVAEFLKAFQSTNEDQFTETALFRRGGRRGGGGGGGGEGGGGECKGGNCKPAVVNRPPVTTTVVTVPSDNNNNNNSGNTNQNNVETSVDPNPQFNFPVFSNPGNDFSQQIQNEVNSQIGEVSAPDTNTSTTDSGGTDTNNGSTSSTEPMPPPTPPQTNVEVAKVQDALDQIQHSQQNLLQQITNVQAPNIDFTPVINAIHEQKPSIDFTPVIEAINSAKPNNTQIIDLLNEIKTQTTATDKPPEKSAEVPIILVTSNFLCKDCSSIVDTAKNVRKKTGRNIRIVHLNGSISNLADPDKKIKLDGLPVIYDFQANRSIVGAADCLEFLNNLN